MCSFFAMPLNMSFLPQGLRQPLNVELKTLVLPHLNCRTVLPEKLISRNSVEDALQR